MQTFLAKSERESRFLSYGASQYVRSSSVIFTFFSCNSWTSRYGTVFFTPLTCKKMHVLVLNLCNFYTGCFLLQFVYL